MSIKLAILIAAACTLIGCKSKEEISQLESIQVAKNFADILRAQGPREASKLITPRLKSELFGKPARTPDQFTEFWFPTKFVFTPYAKEILLVEFSEPNVKVHKSFYSNSGENYEHHYVKGLTIRAKDGDVFREYHCGLIIDKSDNRIIEFNDDPSWL